MGIDSNMFQFLIGHFSCNVLVDSNLQVRVVFSKSLFKISMSYKFQQQHSQFYNFIKSS